MTCSLCREELKEAEIYPSNKDKREILSLKIRCDKHEKGCYWIGELRKRTKHNQECGHVARLCGNDCGELVMRKDRKCHKMNECRRRIVICCYCDEVLEHRLLSSHYTTCANYPVSCPHQCGMEVARKCMKTHTSKEGECPKSPLMCDFASAGCQFVGNRKELQYHLDKETVNHLSLAMRSLHNVTKRLAVAETKLKETDSKLAETQKQQEMIKKAFEKEQKETDRKLAEAEKKQKETEGKLAEAEKKTKGKLATAERKQNTEFEIVKRTLEFELKSLKAVTFFITPGWRNSVESVDFVRDALGNQKQIVLQSNEHFVLFWKIHPVNTSETTFSSDKFYVEYSGLHLQLVLKFEVKRSCDEGDERALAYVTVYRVRGGYASKQIRQRMHQMSMCLLNQLPPTIRRRFGFRYYLAHRLVPPEPANLIKVTERSDFGSGRAVLGERSRDFLIIRPSYSATPSSLEDHLFKLDLTLPEMSYPLRNDELFVTFQLQLARE